MQIPEMFRFFDKIDLTPFKEIATEINQLQNTLGFPDLSQACWKAFQDLPEQGPYFLITENGLYMMTDGHEEPPAHILISGNEMVKIIFNDSSDDVVYAYIKGGKLTLRNKTYTIPSDALVKFLPKQRYKLEEADIVAWYTESPKIKYQFKLPWKYVRLLTNGWEQSIITHLDSEDKNGIFWMKNQKIVSSSDLTSDEVGYQLLGTPEDEDKRVWSFFEKEVYLQNAVLPSGEEAPNFVYGLAQVDKKAASDIQFRSLVPLTDMKQYNVENAILQHSKNYELSLEAGEASNVHLLDIDPNTNSATLTVSGNTTVFGYVVFTVSKKAFSCNTIDDLEIVDSIIADKPFHSSFQIDILDDAVVKFTKTYDSSANETTINFEVNTSQKYDNLHMVAWTSCPKIDENNDNFVLDTGDSLEVFIFSPKTITNAMFVGNVHAFCSEPISIFEYNAKELGDISMMLEKNADAALVIKEVSEPPHINVKIPADFRVVFGETTITSTGDIITLEGTSAYQVLPPETYQAVVYSKANAEITLVPGDIITNLNVRLTFERKI